MDYENTVDQTPMNPDSAPQETAQKPPKKEKRVKRKDTFDEPFTWKDLNMWRTYRKAKRMIATFVSVTVCGIWIYYFGVNMNYISAECYYVTGTYTDPTTNVDHQMAFPSSSSTFGNTKHHYHDQVNVNVSYQFRIITVVGCACWSLMGFVVSAQVMKPLFVLLMFVIPYTATCFVWWFIYCVNTIWADAGKACSDYQTIVNAQTKPDGCEEANNCNWTWNQQTSGFDPEELQMLGIQGLFMQRWIIVFIVFATVFLVPCLPFTSYFLYRRYNRRWRRYKKNQRKADRKRERTALRMQKKQEETMAAAQAQTQNPDNEMAPGMNEDSDDGQAPAFGPQ